MIGARLGVVVLAVVACKKDPKDARVASPPKPEGPRIVAPPKAPPPVIEPARAIALPPVAPGHVRLAVLDVDVAVPDGATTIHYHNVSEVRWASCRVEIEPTWDAKQPRKVGTLVLECRAKLPECAAACDTLTAVPGGTANDPYPSEPPAIELGEGGGNTGEIGEIAYVWMDGTVQFTGEKCERWRGRRGKLPPERVAALVDALDRGGVFRYQPPGSDEFNPCADVSGTWLSVRAHGKQVELATGLVCDKEDPPIIGDSIAAVRSVLGDNPCR